MTSTSERTDQTAVPDRAGGTSGTSPRISLIVVTRNREALLRECLASIDAAVRKSPGIDVELVLVDNGSSDATPSIIVDARRTFTVPVLTARLETPGVCRAKNLALGSIATGSIFAFTDDDCRLEPDFFEKVAAAYRNPLAAELRGGRVELGNPQDLPFTIKTDREPAVYEPPTHPGGFAHGCNLTFSRPVYELIGGFDESFGPGTRIAAAEDTDFVLRAHMAGVPCLYDPDILVHHHHGRRQLEDVERIHAAYSVGNGALYIKHGIRHPGLLRHFYWDCRNALREMTGGPKFDPKLGLGHGARVFGNLRGATQYAKARLRRLVGASPEAGG